MRFFADQDIYQCTVDYLLALEHDVLRAKDAGLARASDEELLHYAHREQRLLITRERALELLSSSSTASTAVLSYCVLTH
jgi:predicted nuclease of predicted toxin-antitoxin system